MRYAILLFLLIPAAASAQLSEAEKKAAIAYVIMLHDPASGAFKADAKSPRSLRATSSAIRVFGNLNAAKLGVKLPDPDKTKSFVLAKFDPMLGAFQEPGGKPDVNVTSIGLMTVRELGFPSASYPLAIEYLKAHAKSFEEVRLGAAALDDLEKKPAWLGDWIKIADAQLNNDGTAGQGDGQARDTASVAAMKLRLGFPLANKPKVAAAILNGQRPDGGWGKAAAKGSDLESTYRVMRALYLLKEKPKDAAKLNAFLAKCRNADGGYGVEPGSASTISGVYFASAISKWMEK